MVISDWDIDKIKVLGEGAFGRVYKAKYKDEFVAVKEIYLHKFPEDRRGSIIEGEVNTFKFITENAKTKYFVKYIGHYFNKIDDKDILVIVMEYVDNDIEDLKGDKLIAEAYFQALQGLYSLHKIGTVHRDIKPDNLLYDEKTKTLKIADFGVSCVRGLAKCNQIVGTFLYMDPQILYSKRQYAKNYASDLYSLAATFYRIYFNEDVCVENPSFMSMSHIYEYFMDRYSYVKDRIEQKMAIKSSKLTRMFLNALKDNLQPFSPRKSAYDLLFEAGYVSSPPKTLRMTKSPSPALSPAQTPAKTPPPPPPQVPNDDDIREAYSILFTLTDEKPTKKQLVEEIDDQYKRLKITLDEKKLSSAINKLKLSFRES
jgi:serine/threonine protein kinase